MSDIPSAWTIAALPQIAALRMGATILSKDLTVAGVPVFSAGTSEEPWGFTKQDVRRFNRGTLVLSARGTIGNPRLPALDEFTCTQTTIAVTPSAVVVPRYLRHQLLGVNWKAITSGGAIPMLTIGMLGELPVSLAPLPEQQRIADKLDTVLARVDACRDRLARVAPLLKRFRQSVLAAATTGRLTDDWRSAQGVDVATQAIRLGEDIVTCPKVWKSCTLAEVIDPARPLCYGVVQPGEEQTDGVRLIRVQDMDRSSISMENLRTVSSVVDAEYRRSRVRGGDLLISVVGTIGRTALVPEGFEGNIARAIARVSSRPSADPLWVNAWLNSTSVQWWLASSSREVARKTLNLSELAALPIALPSTEEQTEIVRRVETLFAFADRLEARLAQAHTAVDRLTPSLLAKAFRGELVPQDPADEPAADLLKRLAAQREAAPARPRRQRTTA